MSEPAGSPEAGEQPQSEPANESQQREAEISQVEVTDAGGSQPGVRIKTPEFMPLQQRSTTGQTASMERFYDVRVPVWAELGRVEMQLGDLLQLGEGAVLRLDRPVGEPVDLVSQGVKLARGEVVVVDDSFAIRIREILSPEK